MAVLPFTNISGWSGDAWIGRGIAETVVTDLQQAGAIAVVGPEPVTDDGRRRGSAPVPQDDASQIELGRRLGVKWVLAGSYQRVADQVRITARGLDIEAGQVAGTVKLDGTIGQIFQLQDRIVRELGVEFGRARVPAAAAPIQKPSPGAPQPAATPRTGATPQILVPTARGASGTTSGAPPTRSASAPPDGAAAGLGLSKIDVSAVRPIDGPPPPVAPDTLSRDAAGRATVRAVRLTEPLKLDGMLDEGIYQTVPALSGFIQQLPNEGAPATERTEAWVLFDGRNVYVSARLWASVPESQWIANEMQRDSFQLINNDRFIIVLDTFYDRRNGVAFMVNPIGG
ncbi:MAG: hypothetical protein HYZ58_07700, partial [Acidobacteria bacterium]|nr:hypothetical protein [Acidobacteriota bacterium]